MTKRRMAKYRFANRLELYLTTHFASAWKLAQTIAPLRRWVNRKLINRAINRVPARPYPLSTKACYTSWDSLTDRTFNSRELPPRPDGARNLPSVEAVVELFKRGEMVECPKSTVLFAYVAQWFTDGFLRSDRSRDTDTRDIRRNESTHEVDLAQLYGLNREVTRMLRAGKRGLLKSQEINGEEFPPSLCISGERKPEFEGLRVLMFDKLPVEQRNELFAMGSDTANTQVGYAMLNVLFLREHNRIARTLADAHPHWDDERLFETARNVLTVLLIKLVIEEYINHLTPYHFQFRFEPSSFPNEPWYRPNWIAVEFNLLYRWHSLIPATLWVGGENLSLQETMNRTKTLLTRAGLGPLFEDASRQPGGKVGLFNTAEWFWSKAEALSIEAGRRVQLRSFNDYLEHCKFPRATGFDQVSSDPKVREALRELYRRADDIELYVGLFAQDTRPNSVLPPLMARLVGVHAFSQLLTNPLLAPHVYNERTFSKPGMEIIEETKSLAALLHRNLPDPSPTYLARLTRTDWTRT